MSGWKAVWFNPHTLPVQCPLLPQAKMSSGRFASHPMMESQTASRRNVWLPCPTPSYTNGLVITPTSNIYNDITLTCSVVVSVPMKHQHPSMNGLLDQLLSQTVPHESCQCWGFSRRCCDLYSFRHRWWWSHCFRQHDNNHWESFAGCGLVSLIRPRLHKRYHYRHGCFFRWWWSNGIRTYTYDRCSHRNRHRSAKQQWQYTQRCHSLWSRRRLCHRHTQRWDEWWTPLTSSAQRLQTLRQMHPIYPSLPIRLHARRSHLFCRHTVNRWRWWFCGYTYVWTDDSGTAQQTTSYNILTDTLLASGTSENWTCEVTPNDGTDGSSSSASVEVEGGCINQGWSWSGFWCRLPWMLVPLVCTVAVKHPFHLPIGFEPDRAWNFLPEWIVVWLYSALHGWSYRWTIGIRICPIQSAVELCWISSVKFPHPSSDGFHLALIKQLCIWSWNVQQVFWSAAQEPTQQRSCPTPRYQTGFTLAFVKVSQSSISMDNWWQPIRVSAIVILCMSCMWWFFCPVSGAKSRCDRFPIIMRPEWRRGSYPIRRWCRWRWICSRRRLRWSRSIHHHTSHRLFFLVPKHRLHANPDDGFNTGDGYWIDQRIWDFRGLRRNRWWWLDTHRKLRLCASKRLCKPSFSMDFPNPTIQGWDDYRLPQSQMGALLNTSVKCTLDATETFPLHKATTSCQRYSW